MTPRFNLRGGRAAVLAGLILLSAVAGPAAVGLASAESFSKQVSDSPRYVVVDQSEISGSYTLEVSTNDAPGTSGDEVLYREDHDATNKQNSIAFGNDMTYENVTITVEGVSSEPDIGPGSAFGQSRWLRSEQFAQTGGDRGFACNLDERMIMAVNPAADIIDCQTLPGTTTVEDTNSGDATQTHIDLYQGTQNSQEQRHNFEVSMSNRLEDAQQVAQIKGKNAYIRSLNNGSSEAAARTAAKAAVQDHYTRMQLNWLAGYEAEIHQWDYLHQTEGNSSHFSADLIYADGAMGLNNESTRNSGDFTYDSIQSKTVTLANGSEHQTIGLHFNLSSEDDVQQTVWFNGGTVFAPSDPITFKLTEVGIQAPTSDFDRLSMLDFGSLSSSNNFTELGQQASTVSDEMDTFVDQTYTEYQNGEINNSDLIDPYVLSSEFSPGSEYQGWAAANLAMLGTNQPTDLSQTGYMNVTLEGGTQYSGVLQTSSNPASGEFVVNETYNPDNLGSTFITTDESVEEIEQNFTLNAIATTGGERQQNFSIEEKTYETTSTEDMAALYDELNGMRAEIEARENALAGGGGGIGDFGGKQQILLIAGVALVAYGFTRDD